MGIFPAKTRIEVIAACLLGVMMSVGCGLGLRFSPSGHVFDQHGYLVERTYSGDRLWGDKLMVRLPQHKVSWTVGMKGISNSWYFVRGGRGQAIIKIDYKQYEIDSTSGLTENAESSGARKGIEDTISWLSSTGHRVGEQTSRSQYRLADKKVEFVEFVLAPGKVHREEKWRIDSFACCTERISKGLVRVGVVRTYLALDAKWTTESRVSAEEFYIGLLRGVECGGLEAYQKERGYR